MNKQESYLDFTLPLAFFDALPVIFFCIAMILIAFQFHNLFFLMGIILCTLAGCGKALWKILVTAKEYDIYILNRQLHTLTRILFRDYRFDYWQTGHSLY